MDQPITVVSLRPEPAFDFRDILSSFAPRAQRCVWSVRNLDWLGENAEEFCKRVDAAGQRGLWLSTSALQEAARDVYQTIEGVFLAFPADTIPDQVNAAELDLGAFPTSRACLAVVAIDGGLFEVYAKDPALLAALRKLEAAREEDPALYFS